MSSKFIKGNVAGEILKFKWEINIDCFKDKDADYKVLSPKFFTYCDDDNHRSDWQLKLYPRGRYLPTGYLSLYLNHLSNNFEYVTFSLSLLNQDNAIVNYYEGKRSFASDNQEEGSVHFVKENFIMDVKNNILKDNKFMILCKIKKEKYYNGQVPEGIEKSIEDNAESSEDESESSEDEKKSSRNESHTQCYKNKKRFDKLDRFEILLKDEEYSDVTVTAEGKSFYLHKWMLSAHSSVFQAMFKNDMKEKFENKVEINDIKYEVLEKLFRFIYTKEINGINNMICELLVAAEKYCVEDLKALCQMTMYKNLNANNAIEYLNSAIINNAEHFKKDAINWISSHMGCFIYKPEFHEFGKQHPSLLLEIMQKSYILDN